MYTQVFQCLLIEGENAGENSLREAEKFIVSDQQFQDFLDRHQSIKCLVPESNQKVILRHRAHTFAQFRSAFQIWKIKWLQFMGNTAINFQFQFITIAFTTYKCAQGYLNLNNSIGARYLNIKPTVNLI